MLTNLMMLTSKRRQHGLTAVEYAVAGGLLVLALATVFAAFGPLLVAKMGAIFGS